MKLLRGDHLTAWARTFAVQGSWNYTSLVGTGIAYAMLPLLRRVYAGDPVRLREAVERAMQPFNGHPYLCGLAVAALARLEYDAVDPTTIERFRRALRGPLGTVGDRAIWAEWRPISLLLGMLVFLLGASPGWSMATFLVLYNAGHIAVRAWGYAVGWQAGLNVGRFLKDSWVEHWGERLWPVNIVLTGLVATLLAGRIVADGGDPLPPGVLVSIACLLGLFAFRFPRRGGRIAGILLLLGPMLWLLGTLVG